MTKRFARVGPFLALSVLLAGQSALPAGGEWPAYGGDAGQRRYSPLWQITPARQNDFGNTNRLTSCNDRGLA
jgi:hypothetical protein